jgi:uncharacterized lipoprotein
MIAGEPRVRRRGFFLHSSDGNDSDMAHGSELENPEGLTARVRATRHSVPRQAAGGGRSHTSSRVESTTPQIRSGSVTGSRQRAHLPR